MACGRKLNRSEETSRALRSEKVPSRFYEEISAKCAGRKNFRCMRILSRQKLHVSQAIRNGDETHSELTEFAFFPFQAS